MTNKPNDVRVSRELKCWSCKAVFTLSDHADCDGCCWKCGVEIDLHEMDIQPADRYPQGTRERFQKWVLSVEHPVKGWLDGHWLRRGDDREGYADEYVQSLWFAFKAFGAQPAEPVVWGSPKTVGQLIRQLQTLDPALETVALYRLPDDIPGVGGKVKQGHISTSYERMEGIWLGPYKGDGRKVLAFWTKLDPRPVPDGEFLMQTLPPDRELVTRRCECPVCWPDHPAHANRPR